MKIGIYDHPSIGGTNGITLSAAVLAEALAAEHAVELVHHDASLTAGTLLTRYGIEPAGIGLRLAARVLPERFRHPRRRARALREWSLSTTAPYDLFVCFSASTPPLCRAAAGVLVVIFPLRLQVRRRAGRAERTLNRIMGGSELRRALASYGVRAANSAFTARWARRRWGIDCAVLYPPAGVETPPVEKRDLILSIGRFTTGGTVKNQLEQMEAFRALKATELRDWDYASVGSLGGWPPDVAYFERVRQIGAECGARVEANLDRPALLELFGRARIFWHAAGLCVDERRRPEALEHFGVVTVEAMSAGCVPVVVARGGQPEIVRHGVDGYLWNTLDELSGYTRRLATDGALLARMADNARERARTFDRRAYIERLIELCEPAIGRPLRSPVPR